MTIRETEADRVAPDLEDILDEQLLGLIGFDRLEPLDGALMTLAFCAGTIAPQHAMRIGRARAIIPDDLELLSALGRVDLNRRHRRPLKPIISWMTDSLISAISASSRSRSIQSSHPRITRRPSLMAKSSSTSSSQILQMGID